MNDRPPFDVHPGAQARFFAETHDRLPRLRYGSALRLVMASQAERRYAVGTSQGDKRRARNARKAARQ